MYGMKKDQLCLLPHDPEWKNDFLREKRRIENALTDRSVRIEHVGSTSIPTIHAKPILDIAILCGGRGLAPVVRALTKAGYEYRGQYDEDRAGHFYAVLERDGVRFCQAHISAESDRDWQLKLLFRDVLAEHPELAREYDEYKVRLAETAADKHEYAALKTRWVDVFIQKVIAARGNS